MAAITNKKRFALCLSALLSAPWLALTNNSFADVTYADANCDLKTPPTDAGETQAHGVILYIYPRTHEIDRTYHGCQNMWFLDDEHFRKLSRVYYVDGQAIRYENIKIFGGIGYQCHYEKELSAEDNDKRCPDYEQLSKPSYQAGCYSKSKLNWADLYEVAFADCRLQ